LPAPYSATEMTMHCNHRDYGLESSVKQRV